MNKIIFYEILYDMTKDEEDSQWFVDFLLFQDSVSNAENAVDNHKSFDLAVSDLTDLIQSINESLEQVHNVPNTKEAVGDALKKVQVTIQYC